MRSIIEKVKVKPSLNMYREGFTDVGDSYFCRFTLYLSGFVKIIKCVCFFMIHLMMKGTKCDAIKYCAC